MNIFAYITLLVMLVAPRSVNVHTYTGYASIYDKGVMGHVARVRGMDIWGCMIATPLSQEIGRRVVVVSHVTGERVVCRIVDVVQRRDMTAHMRNNHLIEFDNPTGLRMCQHKYAGEKPRRSCPVSVTL